MSARPEFLLFVYGTLLRGHPASEILSGCRFLRDASLRGTLYDLGDYPALTLNGDHEVHGELWACPPETLPRLDSYEGLTDGLFSRVRVCVAGRIAWTYVAGPNLIGDLHRGRILTPARWQSISRRRPECP